MVYQIWAGRGKLVKSRVEEALVTGSGERQWERGSGGEAVERCSGERVEIACGNGQCETVTYMSSKASWTAAVGTASMKLIAGKT